EITAVSDYNAETGELLIIGENFKTDHLIDVTKLTLSNGSNQFTLTNQTENVFPSSETGATIVVQNKDRAFVNWILNDNGSRSKDNTIYNLAAAENWNGLAFEYPTNSVSVFNHAPPSLVSSTYNRLTAELDVTASRLAASPDPDKDINAARFTLSGKDGDSYTLTSTTPDVDVISDSRFIIYLEGDDKDEIDLLLDIEGTNSSTGQPYNLASANNWNRPVHPDYNIADPEGVLIDVQNIPNHPPEARDVEITGTPDIGNTLTGSYTYFDLEKDEESDSKFAWYRADNQEGDGAVLIEGETDIEYTITLDDANKYIAFEVTPVALSGIQTGETVVSPFVEVLNTPPSASDVVIEGILEVCKVLEADYDYFDPEDDPAGETEIRWFRADDDLGSNELEIHEGTEYTLALDDEDKYIRIEVTPVASTGSSPGNNISSEYYGPVENMLPTASIT
ncbi:MAG: hypothetical protein LC655_02110, partial [Bacteroidales bacterium]|nr:hypothetical protein [Bacteroidales bacterium]